MLHYFLEFEESIGKVWDKYLNKKVNKFHENERVYFSSISTSLNLFHHLLGGEKGKDLQVRDKRYVKTSRTLLQKISFLGKASTATIISRQSSLRGKEKWFPCMIRTCPVNPSF